MIAIYTTIVCYVYTIVLPSKPSPLNWWFHLLAKMAERTPLSWLAYPLGYCFPCTAGQVTMWASIIMGEGVITSIVMACVAVMLACVMSWINNERWK